MNLFWEGLETTTAYKQMAAITVQKPLLSPLEKYQRDKDLSDQLKKACGT
jgi:hypothetical protein